MCHIVLHIDGWCDGRWALDAPACTGRTAPKESRGEHGHLGKRGAAVNGLNGRLVIVEWVDSSYSPGWLTPGDEDECGVKRCCSVGWVRR